MSYSIETRQLGRDFAGQRAVDAIDLRVPEGSVFGFLGPNGAGKTTTIRMLLGLVRPSRGSIRINGLDLLRQREQALNGVGAIVETPALYPNLSGRDMLELAALAMDCDRAAIPELLDLLQLSEAADRRIGHYSLGMRQRLALARSLLGRPRLLILDEPTNGLDPAGIADMRRLIRELPERFGATILMSSHLLSEIEQTAEHCALIHRGRLVFQGRIESLKSCVPPTLVVDSLAPDRVEAVLSELGWTTRTCASEVRARVDLDAWELAALNRRLVAQGCAVSGLRMERPTLESVFLDQTRLVDASAPLADEAQASRVSA